MNMLQKKLSAANSKNSSGISKTSSTTNFISKNNLQGKKSKSIRLGRNDPYLLKEMFRASKECKIKTLEALLQNEYGTARLPVNCTDDVPGIDGSGWNSLHYLCSSKPLTQEQFMAMDPEDPVEPRRCLDLLCGWNIDINKQDKDGLTPLHVAVLSNNKRLVKLLLFRGADMQLTTKEGNTAITLAQESGYSEIEKILIERDLHLISIKNKKEELKENKKKDGGIFGLGGCCVGQRE
jgi:ankyrin repeat protein